MKTAQRFDAYRFAIAGGIVVGLSIFFITVIVVTSGRGASALEIFMFYPGYEVSYGGSLAGFVWGFVDGFVGFGFFAWLYNHLHRLGK